MWSKIEVIDWSCLWWCTSDVLFTALRPRWTTLWIMSLRSSNPKRWPPLMTMMPVVRWPLVTWEGRTLHSWSWCGYSGTTTATDGTLSLVRLFDALFNFFCGCCCRIVCYSWARRVPEVVECLKFWTCHFCMGSIPVCGHCFSLAILQVKLY